MKIKSLMIATAVAAALHLPVVQAQGMSEMSRGISDASSALSGASGLVVAGSLVTASAAGQLSVAAIQVVGESTVLVLHAVGSAAEVSIRIASDLARDLSIAVGTMVQVVAQGVGYALIASGQLIAFIPNAVGQSLLYQARLK